MAIKVNGVVIKADAEPAQGSVNLDMLADDVVDEIAGAGAGGVPTSRTITAGAGLTGGGDLTANRTLNVGAGTGITVNADDVAVDPAVVALRTYVDDAVQGFTAKGAARVALMATTLAALLGGMTYNAGTKRLTASANGAIGTVDGVADLDVGDLVMIPALTGADATRNGPYYVVQAGDGSTPVILQRAANFDATGDVKPGSYVLIADDDSDHNGWMFHMVTEGPYVLDTTQLAWAARQINIILSGTNPAALGNAAPGTSEEAARADHVHPTTGLVTTSGNQTITDVKTFTSLKLGIGGSQFDVNGQTLVNPGICSHRWTFQAGMVPFVGTVAQVEAIAAPTPGLRVFATDGRNPTLAEGAGAGTGIGAEWNGTAWIVGDGSTLAD